MNKPQLIAIVKLLAITTLSTASYTTSAQVKHNFTMGPNNSTCDSVKFDSVSNLIDLVRQTKFRFAEELKVSRYKTPRHVWFFSCDGKSGFMIGKETDGKEVIFENVKIEDWKALTNSKDPIGQYQILKSKYEEP